MSGLATILSVALAAAPCFTPEDQTAGWKIVSLSAEHPSLAAPSDLEQFRGGEPLRIWTHDPDAYTGAVELHPGKRQHEFRFPAGTDRVVIEFAKDLRGTKVDATLQGNGRTLPLLDEKRIRGNRLELEWSWTDVVALRIVTHHHLRRPPVVGRFSSSRIVVLSEEPKTPEAFRERGVLYYRHPGGRRVTLCDRPGAPLSVDPRNLLGRPVRVR